MPNRIRNIANPFSTGGGGPIFETRVQTSFVVLMLAGGTIPCLNGSKISSIKLQRKRDGFDTDDMVAFTQHPSESFQRKLLVQVKHGLKFTNNRTFRDVINAAWNDFNNVSNFNREFDTISVITGPLSQTDSESVRVILEWARQAADHQEFLNSVNLANFSSDTKRQRLRTFRELLNEANGDDVDDEEVFSFLRCFHVLGFDLDLKAGVSLALLQSLIAMHSTDNAHSLWCQILNEVQTTNFNGGTITKSSFSREIRSAFEPRRVAIAPHDLIPSNTVEANLPSILDDEILGIASLIGSWEGENQYDWEAVKELFGPEIVDISRELRRRLM